MFVVKAEDEEFENIEKETERKELNSVEITEESRAMVELSINSVVGLSNPNTMKVQGKLQDKEVVVLVDCGVTHNFISEKLVKELQLTMRDTSNYRVILDSGTAIKGKGVCESVGVLFNEWEVIEDFFAIGVGWSGCHIRNSVAIFLGYHRGRLEKFNDFFYASK